MAQPAHKPPTADAWLEQAMAQWEVPLLRTCYLLLRDAALAEDAVQETFLKAWRAKGDFRREASEKTWLMRIAVNTCRDMQRGAWFRRIDRRVDMADLPEPSADFAEPDDTLTCAILSLPDALRRVVTLRYYQGLTVQEVADVLRIHRRTVHYRLEKAERALRDVLEDWYHAE